MEKLALHIIAKDEYDQLKRIVCKYGQYFDEIAIAYDDDCIMKDSDKPYHINNAPNVKLYKYKWIDDFSDKRNFLVDKTKSSHYLRMDTDDDIINPEGIKSVFEKMVRNNIDVILCPYIYSRDIDGNCNAKHWRETIIKKSDNHYWKKTVHENIFAENESEYFAIDDPTIQILHNIDTDHIESSGRRNFKILLKEFNETKENPDPRTVAYLGRMLLSFGEYERSIYFLELLVKTSGWNDDKYFAWIDMAHCYLNLGKLDVAIAACNEALGINTDFPDAYNVLGEIYLHKTEYDKAINWLKIGIKKPEPKTHYVVDPSNYKIKAPMVLALALFNKGDFESAYIAYQSAYKLAPNNPIVCSKKGLFETAYDRDQYIKSLAYLYSFTKKSDERKLVHLAESIPLCMYEDERIHSFRNKIIEPKAWNDKSIVIYCGSSWEDWAPPSTINGVGGSEEAVIYISQELTKLGYKVTVFNNCGDMEGEYSGVKYEQFYKFNPRDQFNVIISWRRDMFPRGLKAKKKLVWLHDVPVSGVLRQHYDFDKVMVLSEYHKSLLPKDIPEEKIFVTTNGINLKDFKEYPTIERNPYRLIYTSSYDRGIENLLDIWSEVIKEIPQAELHLFYGWDVYDKMVIEGRRDSKFKDVMLKKLNKPGITEHGRVGHKQLNKELAKSKFWVYPSHFEEISCISAMKAQAMGCVPVCTDYAALKETVKDGVIVKGQASIDDDTNERYKRALIKALKVQPTINVDKEQFGWDKVATQWSEELFNV